MTARLARLEPVDLARFWPFAVMAIVGAVEMALVPIGAWLATWLGGDMLGRGTWKSWPWPVLLLSTPIFLGLLRSFGRLAPTRLRASGAAAGFAAGARAATLYCLHCPETSAIFVLTWYTLTHASRRGCRRAAGAASPALVSKAACRFRCRIAIACDTSIMTSDGVSGGVFREPGAGSPRT